MSCLKHRRDGHEQRIAVLDVPELVGKHARELILVQPLQKPSRNSDGGMLGVAPRAKAFGSRLSMM